MSQQSKEFLRKVMEEIQQVVHRHDVAAVIALHTPSDRQTSDPELIGRGEGELYTQFTPSYSAFVYLAGDMMQLDPARKTDDPTEQWHQVMRTYSMISVLLDLLKANMGAMEDMAAQLKGVLEIEDISFRRQLPPNPLTDN